MPCHACLHMLVAISAGPPLPPTMGCAGNTLWIEMNQKMTKWMLSNRAPRQPAPNAERPDANSSPSGPNATVEQSASITNSTTHNSGLNLVQSAPHSTVEAKATGAQSPKGAADKEASSTSTSVRQDAAATVVEPSAPSGTSHTCTPTWAPTHPLKHSLS